MFVQPSVSAVFDIQNYLSGEGDGCCLQDKILKFSDVK